MKRFKSWLALVLVFSLACSLDFRAFAENNSAAAYARVEEVVYAVAPVNIRTGAGTEHPIVGVLQTGKPIRRIAVGGDRWSQVVYRGETVYIHSSYLTTACPEDLQNETFTLQLRSYHERKELDYTARSWEKVTNAVDEGCAAIQVADQQGLDAAARDLSAAIEALVPMNYEQLKSALDQIPSLGEDRQEGELWLALLDAQQKANELMSGGDQAAVDAACREIENLLTQLKQLPQPEPEVIIQQVPVEVAPDADFCNIPTHGVWRVLLIVSAALAAVLVGAAGLYLFGKKRRRRDNTPLVDYDISDDA